MSMGNLQIDDQPDLLDKYIMNEVLREFIQGRLDALDLNPFEAAKRVGLERGYLNDILIGRKDSIRDDKKPLVAAALGVPVSSLYTATGIVSVPVMGRVGAGAEIEPEFEQVPPEGLFEIDVALSLPPGMIGFEVVGNSMWPRYDAGDVIVCASEGDPLRVDHGIEAAVRTSEGRRFLKRVTRDGDHFVLESHNAPPIRKVSLEWASPVVLTVRQSSWRKLDPPKKFLQKPVSHIKQRKRKT